LGVGADHLEARFATRRRLLIEIHACLIDELREPHKVFGKELEAQVHEIDVNHAAGAHGNIAEVLITRQYGLIF
jgi:hypothetical protein